MNASDNTPEQRLWRRSWALEAHDEAWTEQMRDELVAKTRALLRGRVEVSHLSCRETICRAYLKFETDHDAMAFQQAPHDPALHYEYQAFDPDYDGDPDQRSDHRYEVMIQREDPRASRHAPRVAEHGLVVSGAQDQGSFTIEQTANEG